MWFVKNKPAQGPLERVVLEFSKGNQQRLRHWLNGGTISFGVSGSGKTSGVGMALARGIARQHSGGFIRAAKDSDLAMWMKVFEEAGRLDDDLVIFDSNGAARFNFLDFMTFQGGTVRDVVHALTVIAESIKGGEGKSSQDPFWEAGKERELYRAVSALTIAGEKITGSTLQRFINTAALSTADLASPEWRTKYHNEVLMRGHAKRKTPMEDHEFQLDLDYWANERVMQAPKTRSSILAHVMNVVSIFNSGQVRHLLSTTTTVSPMDMFAGRWVISNLPPGEESNFINAAWVYGTQRAILRRVAKPGDCVLTIWLDEYQTCANSFDPVFLSQCRSHLGSMVCLTQSVPGLYAQFKSRTGKNEADALLANFGTQIFCASCPHTSDYASKWLGDQRQISIGGSMAPQMSLTDELMGNSRFTGSFSESWQPILRSNTFMSGLRTGGPAHGGKVDAIVIRNSEPFRGGQNYLKAVFTQR